MPEIPTKPYYIRAIYEWCVDNGYTPHLSVMVDAQTEVPQAYVEDGEIVLNVSPLATQGLKIGNELIEFQARFGGVAQQIFVPVVRVQAVYARENGQGMVFEVSESPESFSDHDSSGQGSRSGGSAPVTSLKEVQGPTLSSVPNSTESSVEEQAKDSPPGPDDEGGGGKKASKKSSKKRKNHLTRVK